MNDGTELDFDICESQEKIKKIGKELKNSPFVNIDDKLIVRSECVHYILFDTKFKEEKNMVMGTN